MVPAPIALGLTICEKVIVEQGTIRVSLISIFNMLEAAEFPHTPPPFCVFASLTGGEGSATATLTITRMETDEVIEAAPMPLTFPNRFAISHALFRFNDREFPSPGTYMFTLLVDGDWVAHRRLYVVAT